MLSLQLVLTRFGGAKITLMDKKHDTITFAVSLIIKAAIVAAKYSGRVRKRSLKRLAAMDINVLVKHSWDHRKTTRFSIFVSC
jgi:hypothetical protein